MPAAKTKDAAKRKPYTKQNTKGNNSKKPIPEDERIKRRYIALNAQIEDGYPLHALRTTEQLLRLNEDDLARQTKARLLIQLNKFAEVAEVVQEDEGLLLQRAYALYKLGREKAALELIEGKTEDDRGLRALEAQIRYKLEEYQSSADIYEELLDAADIDSPEHADLQTNLQAAQAHLDFLSSIPTKLSEASDSLPPFEVLESTPVSTLIAADPALRSRPKQLPTQPAPTSTTSKPSKLPKVIAALPESERPAPDPDRWQRKKRKVNKREERIKLQREKAAMQGGQGSASEVKNTPGKKKKGKR